MLPVTGVVVVAARRGKAPDKLAATTRPRSVLERPMLIIH
jgi:hypothetical protein